MRKFLILTMLCLSGCQLGVLKQAGYDYYIATQEYAEAKNKEIAKPAGDVFLEQVRASNWTGISSQDCQDYKDQVFPLALEYSLISDTEETYDLVRRAGVEFQLAIDKAKK